MYGYYTHTYIRTYVEEIGFPLKIPVEKFHDGKRVKRLNFFGRYQASSKIRVL